MKFSVLFQGSPSYQVVRGIALLDLAREIAPTIAAADVVDAQTPNLEAVVEIGEELARECGHFANEVRYLVRVCADRDAWLGLFRAVSVELSAEKMIRPIIKVDGAPLLDAWRAAGFPKELIYPLPAPEEADEEAASEYGDD